MTNTGSDAGRRRVRLLPVVIIAIAAGLIMRVGELSLGIDWSPASPALAAEHEDGKNPTAAAGDAADGAADGAADRSAAPRRKDARRTTDFPVEFTPAEVAVLQDLAGRRDALIALEKELGEREQLLAAAESRLEKRIGELEQIRDSIEALVRQYDEQEAAELQSIVKIYETMKPQDAARILEDLETEILLGIMETMKERKSAPILAAMGAERARELTAEMARRSAIDLSTSAGRNEPSG